jgi:hypothetical protein
MNCSRVVIVCILLLANSLTAQSKAAPDPCAANEQHQFDFWMGNWDATWPGSKAGEIRHGSNSIRRVLDGCVVEENFSGGSDMHLRGRSLSIYDTRSHKWKQTWVDNEGGYLDFTGEFKNGQMVLAREAVRPDGSHVLQRMVYKNITPDEFDWSWESSKDAGKTWQVVWPIHYRRRK